MCFFVCCLFGLSCVCLSVVFVVLCVCFFFVYCVGLVCAVSFWLIVAFVVVVCSVVRVSVCGLLFVFDC